MPRIFMDFVDKSGFYVLPYVFSHNFLLWLGTVYTMSLMYYIGKFLPVNNLSTYDYEHPKPTNEVATTCKFLIDLPKKVTLKNGRT